MAQPARVGEVSFRAERSLRSRLPRADLAPPRQAADAGSWLALSAALGSCGAGLLVVGFVVLQSNAVMGFGLASLILALVSAGLQGGQPAVSPEASRAMWEAANFNLNALIEEYGLQGRAIFIPSRMSGAPGRALILAHPVPDLSSLPAPLPRRLLVQVGSGADDIGLLVATPGGKLLSVDPVSEDDAVLQSALRNLLVSTLRAASEVHVFATSTGARVEIFEPHFGPDLVAHQVAGSPLAAMAAGMAAEAWDCPVVVQEQKVGNGPLRVQLERVP